MIQRLLLWRLAVAERRLGESLEWMRVVIRASLNASLRFVTFLPMTRLRRALPRDAYHVSKIVAVRDEDCGACLQTVVSAAKADGVPIPILRAVLARAPDALPDDCADVY